MKRLVESLTESETPMVVIKQRADDYHVCPHCHKEIQEKSTGYDVETNEHIHRPCGGRFKMPPPDMSKISPEWRHIFNTK